MEKILSRVKRTKDIERGSLEVENAFEPSRASVGRKRGEDSFYNNAPAIVESDAANDLLASMDPKIRSRMADSIKTMVFFDEIGALH